MLDTATDTRTSIDDIKTDLNQLKGDLATLASELADKGVRKAKRGAESTREAAEEYHAQLVETVSERPIASLAIAFGVGVVLAKLVSFRS